MKIVDELLFSTYKPNGLFVILLTDGAISDIQEIFKLLWKNHIFDVNVMFESESGVVFVQTFMPFGDGKCNDTTPVLINEFKNGKLVQGTERFFPKKIKNMHNCVVKVGITNMSEPFSIVRALPNGSLSFQAFKIKIIDTLAESLSFQINFTFLETVGFILENGSVAGSFESLLN